MIAQDIEIEFGLHHYSSKLRYECELNEGILEAWNLLVLKWSTVMKFASDVLVPFDDIVRTKIGTRKEVSAAFEHEATFEGGHEGRFIEAKLRIRNRLKVKIMRRVKT